MYYNFLQSCILEPTRTVANNRPSITDNIFINNIDKKTDKKNISENKNKRYEKLQQSQIPERTRRN